MHANRWAPLVLGALMLLPAGAAPAMAAGQDFEHFQAQQRSAAESVLALPSELDAERAGALLAAAGRGPLAGEDALELVRFVRDAPQGELDAMTATWMALGLQGAQPREAWQQEFWDNYGIVLTALYVGAGMVPHNLRIPGVMLKLGVNLGCTGNPLEGYCYARATADVLGLAALDFHQSTDSIVAHLPLAIEVRAHWRCSWSGCSTWTETVEPASLVAQNAQYVLGFPSASGTIATRATDMDLLQSAYDRFAHVNKPKPREATSAPLPPGALVPGGTPGFADLNAVAPAPTYYGAQGGAMQWGAVHGRTAAPDRAGLTVAWGTEEVRAWSLNVAIVRWKNAGAGSANSATPPATLYYDVGRYMDGASGNVWSFDYSLRDPLLG